MARVVDLRKKGEETISWESDYSVHASVIWQRFLIFFLVVIVVLFIIFKQGFILIIFFSLLLLVFILYVKNGPKIITVSLSRNHIQFGKRFIPYLEIESFWIIYEPQGLKELSLHQKSWHSTYLKIPIYGQDPIQIRGFLLNYIPEERHEDSIFDILGRKFGI